MDEITNVPRDTFKALLHCRNHRAIKRYLLDASGPRQAIENVWERWRREWVSATGENESWARHQSDAIFHKIPIARPVPLGGIKPGHESVVHKTIEKIWSSRRIVRLT